MRGNLRALNASLRTADLTSEEAALQRARQRVDEVAEAIARGQAEMARLRAERDALNTNPADWGQAVSAALLSGAELSATMHSIASEKSAIGEKLAALSEGLASLGSERTDAARELRLAQDDMRNAYGLQAAEFVQELHEEAIERLEELATIYATLRALDSATGGTAGRATADDLAQCIGQTEAFSLGLGRAPIVVPADVQAALSQDGPLARSVPDTIPAPTAKPDPAQNLMIAAAAHRAQ